MAKVETAVKNAKAFLEIQEEWGTFDDYIWSFTEGKVVKNKRKTMKQIPATSKLSDTVSKDLKKRGFTFVGSTIVYAWRKAFYWMTSNDSWMMNPSKLVRPAISIGFANPIANTVRPI